MNEPILPVMSETALRELMIRVLKKERLADLFDRGKISQDQYIRINISRPSIPSGRLKDCRASCRCQNPRGLLAHFRNVATR
jgi:hypothetical protein